MNSYFANASEKELSELKNEYEFSIDGSYVHSRLLTSHEATAPTTNPSSSPPTAAPTAPSYVKPTVKEDGTVSEGTMRGNWYKDEKKCASGADGCYTDSNGNEYQTKCASV